MALVWTMDPINELAQIIRLTPQNIQQIRQGAFVIFKDHGALYRKWTKRGKPRWSRHSSSAPTFEVFAIKGVILTGKTTEGHTWFQWERSKCCSCSHVVDWARYMFVYKNQGPDGESEYTQNKPYTFTPITV